jgi:hypothetical protein
MAKMIGMGGEKKGKRKKRGAVEGKNEWGKKENCIGEGRERKGKIAKNGKERGKRKEKKLALG